MAKNIEMNIKTSSGYEVLYPRTTASQTGALPLTGGTMRGNIAMGNRKITGLGSPSAGTDAVNKTYVDNNITNSNVFVKSGSQTFNLGPFSGTKYVETNVNILLESNYQNHTIISIIISSFSVTTTASKATGQANIYLKPTTYGSDFYFISDGNSSYRNNFTYPETKLLMIRQNLYGIASNSMSMNIMEGNIQAVKFSIGYNSIDNNAKITVSNFTMTFYYYDLVK